MEKPAAACYHLPGLFEFYELYRRFLPLYREHREFFYEWCTIYLRRTGGLYLGRGTHLLRRSNGARGAGAAVGIRHLRAADLQ